MSTLLDALKKDIVSTDIGCFYPIGMRWFGQLVLFWFRAMRSKHSGTVFVGV